MTDNIRPQQAGQRRSKIMGRPLGSRDRFPRGTAKGEKINLLETALGQRDRRIADLEHELAQYQQPFPGDAVALLEATQHGHYAPSWMQFRAALALFERDWDRQRVELDGQRAELDQERAQYRSGDETLERLIADFREFICDREDELVALVAAGDVTQAAATKIRAWWFVAKEPLALPAPAAPSAVQRDQAETPTEPHPDAIHALPWATPRPDEPAPWTLLCDRAFLVFQTASGRRFESNSACEVEVDGADDDDVKDLLRAGCRERK